MRLHRSLPSSPDPSRPRRLPLRRLLRASRARLLLEQGLQPPSPRVNRVPSLVHVREFPRRRWPVRVVRMIVVSAEIVAIAAAVRASVAIVVAAVRVRAITRSLPRRACLVPVAARSRAHLVRATTRSRTPRACLAPAVARVAAVLVPRADLVPVAARVADLVLARQVLVLART